MDGVDFKAGPMNLPIMEYLDCQYRKTCGGCPWGDKDYDTQLSEKRTPFPEAVFAFQPRARVRDRVDLIWQDGRLGLYARDSREVLDLEACPMMTPALEDWFKLYRTKKPPIKKGSVRLRVSPQGERGVWLDFANQDVKTLFEEREYLAWVSAQAFVEVGQRRKALIFKDGQPKLVDPVLKPWFETYGGGRTIPVYGPVGGFSQTGFEANRALVGTVLEFAKGTSSWLELFSGSGNFAMALAAAGHEVEAIELEPLSVEGLKRSADEAGLKIKISCGDVYLKADKLPEIGARGLLVDPPRAGLREVLRVIERDPPAQLLYVSCFSESFLKDQARLEELGYAKEKIVGVDQFPFSPHSEWVALFKKLTL